MNITVRVPDDIARRLGTPSDLERRALEALAAQEYRLGHLSDPELRRLLGFEADAPLDSFLNEHAGIEPNVSVRRALDEETRARAGQAAADIIARRKGISLGGLEIKDLINEGRR